MEHPITPPPELVRQWAIFGGTLYEDLSVLCESVATQAARWGADQQLDLDAEQINQAWQKGADAELEACCEWLSNRSSLTERLRAARRPKPPSLAEQALAQTNAILTDPNRALLAEVRETLELNRRTLKRLQELENNG